MLDRLRAITILTSIETRLDRLIATQEFMRDDLKMLAEGHAATQALLERSFVAMHARIKSLGDPGGAQDVAAPGR
jgi:hypothetical protein